MKKFLLPSLLAVFAMGLSQQEARAGFSIDISIGDHHRRVPPPVVIARPPVFVARPPVVIFDPRRDDCDRGYRHSYVRECDHYSNRYYRHEHDRYHHDRYRHEPRRDFHGGR